MVGKFCTGAKGNVAKKQQMLKAASLACLNHTTTWCFWHCDNHLYRSVSTAILKLKLHWTNYWHTNIWQTHTAYICISD